tara:strand:+ start:480 stop:767 length:288 start_codon:yes stop_codon:yes gene_type:complete
MKKYLLLPILLFATPSPAIAIEPINYPANFIELSNGVVYNLDHLAGTGVQQIIAVQKLKPVEKPTESREVRDNKRRVNFENARNLILIEQLRNMR